METQSQLISDATTNIKNALADTRIFSSPFQPVWGPYLSTSQDPNNTSEYVTDNLLYVAKGTNPDASGRPILYVVGVAGTNPVSHAGWFNEDLAVTSTVPWSKTDSTQGNISAGAADGLGILTSLNNSSQTILQFFQNELKGADTSKVEIAVAGHSLGGALSPLLALYLSQNLKSQFSNLIVSAWPTAGPTPGDSTFASFLTGSKGLGSSNYNSCYNQNDIVPHAWQSGMLQQIPTLYASFSSPLDNKPITNYPVVNGTVVWAGKQAPSGTVYTRSSPDTTFAGQALTDWDTGKIKEDADGLFLEHHKALAAIYKNGGGSGIMGAGDVQNFLVFMMEAGYQHIGAYLQAYLNPQILTTPPVMLLALRSYMNAAGPTGDAKQLDLDNLGDFLEDAANG